MEFSIVAAFQFRDGGIGYQGGLPWPRNSADMQRFRNLTSYHDGMDEKRNALIMGRRTFESLPASVGKTGKRTLVVVSSTLNPEDFIAGDDNQAHIERRLDAALKWCARPESHVERVFVIGGARLFEEAARSAWCDKAYISEFRGSAYPCDTFLSKAFFHAVTSTTGTILDRVDNADGSQLVVSRYDVAKHHENKDERQYLDLVQRCLRHGIERPDRTGVGTLAVFGAQMRFDLRDNAFPLLTTKRTFLRGIIEELLWMLRGATDARELQARNVRIWDGNTTRAFLDKTGLSSYPEGCCGPIYGYQWRHWGAEYDPATCGVREGANPGIDQLAQCIELIKRDPTSRRIVMTAWNPDQLDEMCLPPCHMQVQFFVDTHRGELSTHMYQRSADMGLGVPFNIASYALLTIVMARLCGLRPGEFVHSLGDTHVYLNHVEQLKEQISRRPYLFPRLTVRPGANPDNAIDGFECGDFVLEHYRSHPAIKMPMAQ
jgi:dihydrofolate reductase/thymidylate synthase